MHSSIRRLVNVVKTCKEAVRACLKSVRGIEVFGSKRSRRARDAATVASSDTPQQAGTPVTIDLPEETTLVSSVRQETVPTSAVHDENLQSKRRPKRVRRKRVKSRLNPEDVLLTDESGPATENAADITLSFCSNNEEQPCKSQAMVVSEQSDDAGDVVEFWRIIGKVRKQRAGHSDKVPCVKEQQSANKPDRTSSKRTEISVSSRCETDHENKPVDASNKSRGNTAIMKSSEHEKRSAKRLRRKTTVKPEAEKLLPVKVNESGNPADVSRSNNEEEPCESLGDVTAVGEQAEDAGDVSGHWRTVAKPRKRRVDQSDGAPCAKEQLRVNKPDRIRSCLAGRSSSVRFERKTAYEKKPARFSSSRELNHNVKFILNTMTPGNIAVSSKNFAALPIDTIERLESTVDLVFEKAIQKQILAQLCAVLCSAAQSVSVTCEKSKRTTSFQAHILRKCQSSFEADKANRTDSAKKLAEIKSCRNPKKKKELQFDYDENEKRWRKRSVGNCRFIGELFKQRILRISIFQYCIENLASQRSESALECLCNLLKTAGKEYGQCCNLNETFDKLKSLTSEISISSRMRLMIKEVMDL